MIVRAGEPTEADADAPDRLQGWRAICAALGELGWPMSRFACARALERTRRTRIPIDGPHYRPFSTKDALAAWVSEERERHNRTVLAIAAQLPLAL